MTSNLWVFELILNFSPFRILLNASSIPSTYPFTKIIVGDYGWRERGAGYIQLTGEGIQRAFLIKMGASYNGDIPAEYIAENLSQNILNFHLIFLPAH